MWDGRFRSLEEQAFGPFRRRGEMGIGIKDAAAEFLRDRIIDFDSSAYSDSHPPGWDGCGPSCIRTAPW